MSIQYLSGHVNQETALVLENYPYGFRLRCKVRYWVETAVKGSAKGQQRFATQTTDPKKSSETFDFWNKPKYSNYSDIIIMTLEKGKETEKGKVIDEVSYMAINNYSSIEKIEEFETATKDILTEEQKKSLTFLKAVRKASDKMKYKVVSSQEHESMLKERGQTEEEFRTDEKKFFKQAVLSEYFQLKNEAQDSIK